MATPAISDGLLVIRTLKHVVGIADESSGAQPRSGVSPRGPSAGIHSRREPPKGANLAMR